MRIKTHKGSISRVALTAIFLRLFIVGSTASAAVKGDWSILGSSEYEIGKDKDVYHIKSPSCYIRSMGWPEGYGMVVNQIKAKPFIGKRVRMSAYIKTERVTEWAGMTMRVDGKNPNDRLGFDNMHARPIRGTTEWQRYEIVLDVPQSAKTIIFGLLLAGPGKAWLDDYTFDVVGSDVSTTGF
ncbi:MAG: AraC/XylS family transcriptional regulator [Acidobacteria bacterium]|nr:AraC/XylS family transcriptional regulator [Acidobacteriota bacterium]